MRARTSRPRARSRRSRDDAKSYGPFADAYLALYKATNDTEAAGSERAVRDTRINWPNRQWANAQARSGKSKVFYYYFAHHPPAPPDEKYVEGLGKDLGAYHGAELAYVFGNFVPREWAWTDADRALEKTVSQYWVNFATRRSQRAGPSDVAGLRSGDRHRSSISKRRSRPDRCRTKLLRLLGQVRRGVEGPGVISKRRRMRPLRRSHLVTMPRQRGAPRWRICSA